MGVYVPQQPTTSILRVFFFLCVPFCFAISTVFQAFFVSYLVQQNYEKKLDPLDELLDSEEVYGYHHVVNFVQDNLESLEFVTFLQFKRLKEDFSDPRKCVEPMITKGDIASIIAIFLLLILQGKCGLWMSVICSLDYEFVSGGATVLYKNGNPLLERFRFIMRSRFAGKSLDRTAASRFIEGCRQIYGSSW